MKRTFFSAIALTIMLASCIGQPKSSSQCADTDNSEYNNVAIDDKSEKCSYGADELDNVVEVLSFHGAKRCITCRAIENLTKEVVESDFAEEVKSGKLKMRIIDITSKEGEAIADNYEVATSSLYINKWSEGKESRNDMTRLGFTKAKNSPEEFKAEVREKIALLLK